MASTLLMPPRAAPRAALALVAAIASVLVGGCSTAGAGSESSTLPCPPPARGQSLIDWVPFVIIDGQMYATLYDDPEQVVDEEQVGAVVATVSCRVADLGDPDFEPREGDAAYLPAGTEVHKVHGRPTTEALTAYEEGTWWLFEPIEE